MNWAGRGWILGPGEADPPSTFPLQAQPWEKDKMVSEVVAAVGGYWRLESGF